MKRMLMTTFAGAADAEAARNALAAEPELAQAASTRLHEGELDLRMASDIDTTPAAHADENSVLARFGSAFFAFLALGGALDLAGVVGGVGLPMTMTLGSLGVFVGMLAVLWAERRPLDDALAEAQRRLEGGEVLLTVSVDESRAERAAAALRRSGGRDVFTA